MNWFFGDFIGGRAAWGLLILRIVAGIGIMLHGIPKIQNPFTWMGPDGFAPALQAAAAASEFFGGALWILGLLTPLASLGIAAVMVTAISFVHLKQGDPFVAPPGWEGGSAEAAVFYFIIALALLFVGPGKLSLDARWLMSEPHRDRTFTKNEDMVKTPRKPRTV